MLGAGLFGLFGDGDAEAASDEAGEIDVRGDDRDAAHGNGGAGVFTAMGQRDVQGGGGGVRVVEKHLEEVAHAEEQQGVRLLRLQRKPLGDGRRRLLSLHS